MNFKFAVALGLSLNCLFTITGCNEQSDADKVASAQLCLDKATASTAQACAAMLVGIDTPQSYIVRCSADFTEQGFDDASRLVTAINSVTGNSANTPALLSFLAFTKKPSNSNNTTNATNADQTFTYCEKSGQKGLALIASLAKSATQIAGLANSMSSGINFSDPSTFTSSNIQKALTDLASSGTASVPVGQTVQAVYTTTCASGSQANQSICDQLNSAAVSNGINFTTSTPQQIGDALVNYWKTH